MADPKMPASIKVATTSFTPVFLDKTATTDKVCKLIREAGAQGACVIAFPETAIAGYPGWGQVIPAEGKEANELALRLFQNCVEVPGPETAQISAACAEAGIYAVVGINERIAGTTGTMYNSQLFFGPDGKLLLKHQKFVPTVTERIVHAPGQTGSAAAVQTSVFGGLSALICGENYNPLALYSTSLDYPVVHVASWPPHFAPEADTLETVLSVTKGVAKILGTFVLNSVNIDDEVAMEMYGKGQASSVREGLVRHQRTMGATVIGPSGKVIAGPLAAGEEILYAEIRPEDVVKTKVAIDVAGHYNRPEVFAHHFKNYL